jgi:hypothetical protein
LFFKNKEIRSKFQRIVNTIDTKNALELIENRTSEIILTIIVTITNQLASFFSSLVLYNSRAIYPSSIAIQLKTTSVLGAPRVGRPSTPITPIFGITLKIFPPKRDMRLKNEVRILPIKKEFSKFNISFFVEINVLTRKVSRNKAVKPISPELNW